jgi:hypothetical protein
MEKETTIRVDEIQGGDEIRFAHQRTHRKVKAALPISGDMTIIIIPGHDNFLQKNEAIVYRKIQRP